ncbi:MAG: UDP-N-acetylmuramate dehydrogenase [Candidatus Spechtbacterales bacterium]
MTVQENIKLAPYTTYKIGGPARYFAKCETDNDVAEALAWAKKNNVPYFILGGGSNVLISDNGYKGLVICIKNVDYELNGDVLDADAGAQMSVVVEETASAGMAGLEWAGGLPGKLGGAIRGNAGAFGGEIKDSIVSVRAMTPDGDIKIFKSGDCAFSYRSSVFKENPEYIILSAQFKLKKGKKDELMKKVSELVEWRRTKHPMEYGNCGSVFKRKSTREVPDNILEKYTDINNAIRDGQVATAFFIDECGLKNKRIGGAEVSDKHPNFLINSTGNACAEDVIMLAGTVKSRVLHQFGVNIEEEIEFVGF